MKRRSFFAALLGIAVAPPAIKAAIDAGVSDFACGGFVPSTPYLVGDCIQHYHFTIHGTSSTVSAQRVAEYIKAAGRGRIQGL